MSENIQKTDNPKQQGALAQINSMIEEKSAPILDQVKSLESKLEQKEQEIKSLEKSIESVNSKIAGISSVDMNREDEITAKERKELQNTLNDIYETKIPVARFNFKDLNRFNLSVKSTTGRMDNMTLGGALSRPLYALPKDQTIASNITGILNEVNTIRVNLAAGEVQTYQETIFERNFRSPIERRKILATNAARDFSVAFDSKSIEVRPYSIEEQMQRQVFSSKVVNAEQIVLKTIYESFDYQVAYDILIGNEQSSKNIGKLAVPSDNMINASVSDKIIFDDILTLIRSKTIPMDVLSQSTIVCNMSALLSLSYELGTTNYYKNEKLVEFGKLKMVIGNMNIVVIDDHDMPFLNGVPCLYMGNFNKAYQLYRGNSGSITFETQYNIVKNDRVNMIYEESIGGGDVGSKNYIYGINAKI